MFIANDGETSFLLISLPERLHRNMSEINKTIDSLSVAAAAGVSRSTVSRVLNRPEIVRPETRERVMDAIRQFGYTPKLSGQLLTGKKSNTIGLFISTAAPTNTQDLQDSHMDYILRCILSRASLRGYHTLVTLIFDYEDPGVGTRIAEMFQQGRVEAGVFIGFPENYPGIERLVEDGYCVGIFDTSIEKKTERNRVVVDFDDSVGEGAVDYLVSLGHRNIGAVHGALDRYNGRQKHDGFMRSMVKHGLPIRDDWMMYCRFKMDLAREQIRGLLARGTDLPTAIVATNDAIAFATVEVLNEANLRVPDDISVIGADDSFISQFYTPPLTTFRIDFKEMLEVLTDQVIEYVASPFETQFARTFGAVLVERESCRKI
ncbi:MAG: LacI family DNA-binding transcriptional regulator [Propionibacteriaceae bacterium]